jgi:hypothetical protein
VHVTAFAAKANLTDAQIESTLHEQQDLSTWPEHLALLLEVCDGLCRHGRLEPTLRERLQHRWEADAQLEIFALVGFYHTISNIANAADMGLEPWGRRFPR